MKKYTKIFLGITLLLIVAYDLFAYTNGGNPATISYWFWTESREQPAIAFLFGFVCGHLFWQSKDNGIGDS